MRILLPSLSLRQDIVSVLEIDASGVSEESGWQSLLSQAERERAASLASAPARRMFAVSHAALRYVLGQVVGRPPTSLSFCAGPSGKPMLEQESETAVEFNLAHSGTIIVLAFALGRRVGVDVEQERQLDVVGLIERFFTPREVEELSCLSRDQYQRAFFRCWTRKEAIVKARGEALPPRLRSFDVGMDSSPEPRHVLCREVDLSTTVWVVRSLETLPGYAAAVAAEGTGWSVDKLSFLAMNRPGTFL